MLHRHSGTFALRHSEPQAKNPLAPSPREPFHDAKGREMRMLHSAQYDAGVGGVDGGARLPKRAQTWRCGMGWADEEIGPYGHTTHIFPAERRRPLSRLPEPFTLRHSEPQAKNPLAPSLREPFHDAKGRKMRMLRSAQHDAGVGGRRAPRKGGERVHRAVSKFFLLLFLARKRRREKGLSRGYRPGPGAGRPGPGKGPGTVRAPRGTCPCPPRSSSPWGRT